MTSSDYEYLNAVFPIICFIVPAYELIFKKTQEKGLNKISNIGWVCFVIAIIWGAISYFSIAQSKTEKKEVHRSNMSKLHNGVCIKRDDGKVLKSPEYSNPNLSAIINNPPILFEWQDRETSLETAVKFHKQVAEEAIQEQARLLLENEKLRETNQELTNFLSAIQHERNKNELH